MQADWYDGVASTWRGAAFDLIASNPPYVAAADPHLAEGDVRFEPGPGAHARRRRPRGDRAHRRRRARPASCRGGTLVVEHGYDQAEAVRALFLAAGFAEIVGARDLAGIPRVVAGRLAVQAGQVQILSGVLPVTELSLVTRTPPSL